MVSDQRAGSSAFKVMHQKRESGSLKWKSVLLFGIEDIAFSSKRMGGQHRFTR